MRHRSLLAAMRGDDGRSLARALILLVLVGVFAGGLNAGAVAAAGPAAVICNVGDDGSTPPAHVAVDCCLAGVTPLGMALAPSLPSVGVPAIAAASGQPSPGGSAAVELHRPAPLARGPPSFA